MTLRRKQRVSVNGTDRRSQVVALQRLSKSRRPERRNDSGQPVARGQVFGLDNVNRKTKLARAGDVRALWVATKNAGGGERIEYDSSGLLPLRVEGAISVLPGDPCYLSASEAGSVTNIHPAGFAQLLGSFSTSRENNSAYATLHRNLVASNPATSGAASKGATGADGTDGVDSTVNGVDGAPGVGANGYGIPPGASARKYLGVNAPGGPPQWFWKPMDGISYYAGQTPLGGEVSVSGPMAIAGSLTVSAASAPLDNPSLTIYSSMGSSIRGYLIAGVEYTNMIAANTLAITTPSIIMHNGTLTAGGIIFIGELWAGVLTDGGEVVVSAASIAAIKTLGGLTPP